MLSSARSLHDHRKPAKLQSPDAAHSQEVLLQRGAAGPRGGGVSVRCILQRHPLEAGRAAPRHLDWGTQGRTGQEGPLAPCPGVHTVASPQIRQAQGILQLRPASFIYTEPMLACCSSCRRWYHAASACCSSGSMAYGRQRAQLRARTEAQKQATPRRHAAGQRMQGTQRTGSCACPPACVVALAPRRAPAPQPPASSRCTPGSHPGACWLPVPCRQTRWCRPLAAGPQPPPSVSASALGWEGRRALASALD